MLRFEREPSEEQKKNNAGHFWLRVEFTTTRQHGRISQWATRARTTAIRTLWWLDNTAARPNFTVSHPRQNYSDTNIMVVRFQDPGHDRRVAAVFVFLSEHCILLRINLTQLVVDTSRYAHRSPATLQQCIYTHFVPGIDFIVCVFLPQRAPLARLPPLIDPTWTTLFSIPWRRGLFLLLLEEPSSLPGIFFFFHGVFCFSRSSFLSHLLSITTVFSFFFEYLKFWPFFDSVSFVRSVLNFVSDFFFSRPFIIRMSIMSIEHIPKT